MMPPAHEAKAPATEDNECISMCSLEAGGRLFGIDTRSIREVLGHRGVQRVPLAPAWIGGIVPYRGEVLTAVSFRALLGMPPNPRHSCLLVFDGNQQGEQEGERFGLMVDNVGGVMSVERSTHAPNPPTLDAASRAMFAGAFRLPGGLLVQVDPARLQPDRLVESGLFGPQHYKEPPCAH